MDIGRLIGLGKELGLSGKALQQWVDKERDIENEKYALRREDARVKAREEHEHEMARIKAEAAQLRAALQQIELVAQNGCLLSSDSSVEDYASNNMDTNVSYIEGDCGEARTNGRLDPVMSAGVDEPSLENGPDLLGHVSCSLESASAVDVKEAKGVSKSGKGYTSSVTIDKSVKWHEWHVERADCQGMAVNDMNFEVGVSSEYEDKEILLRAFRSSDESPPLTNSAQGRNLRTEVTARDAVYAKYSVANETAAGPMLCDEVQSSISEERAQGKDPLLNYRASQVYGALYGRKNSFRYFWWLTRKATGKLSDPKRFEMLCLQFSAFNIAEAPWSHVGLVPRRARQSELHLRKRTRFSKKRKKRKGSSENSHRTHCRKKKNKELKRTC